MSVRGRVWLGVPMRIQTVYVSICGHVRVSCVYLCVSACCASVRACVVGLVTEAYV